MAKYLVSHPDETGAIYVTDYTTGKMFSPELGWFVPVRLNRDTGERDYRAYRKQADANSAALVESEMPERWNAVMASASR
jgi:hypothetical protein